MSIGSSLSGITFGGLSSGIDTDSIISRLSQLEQVPINRIRQQQAQLTAKAGTYGNLLTQISNVGRSANALNSQGTFNPITTSSSNAIAATVTASNAATAGTYNISISRLATANKVATTAQSSISTALNQTGTFVVNGKAVNVVATDTLQSLASKINDLQVGATASLIDGGNGNAFLTITAGSMGAANRIQMADLTGSVLSNLGMVTGSTSVRQTTTNGALGGLFGSPTDTVQTMLGASGLGAQTVQINGTNVSLNLSTDSLQGVANKINAAVSGITASVETVNDASGTKYRLNIVGTTTPTFTDAGNTLQTLGILQRAAGNELVAGADAQYTLDGVSLTSATNTITTVIPGATINLNKANATTPETATLTLTKDNGAIKSKINEFVTAYNNAIGFIRDNGKFDPETFQSGPLFGDSATNQFEQTMANMIFNDVPGVTGDYRNLATIGFGLDADGKIVVDDAAFDKALAAQPEQVRRIFQSVGSSANPNITYVSSTSKTTASPSTGFAVNITQAATKSTLTAGLAQIGNRLTAETLTFSGSMFGATPVQITLNSGTNLASTVAAINSDSRLRDNVLATIEGGKLKVESKRWGTAGQFDLVSNQSPLATNSGVGPGGTSVKVNGLDVAGTIGLQAATGFGQFLTGASTNTVAQGLQIQYTGTTTGAIGNISFSKGMGSILGDLVSGFNDIQNGLITTTQKSLQDQVDQMDTQITNIQKSVDLKISDLRRRFAAMEQSISAAQAQGARLSAMR